MKLQLIMLKDPIIVSDEEIKEGDFIFNRSGLKYDEQVISKASKNAEINWASNMKINGGKTSIRECIFKIIAGIPELPQIDWNELEAEFGYVDVEILSFGYASVLWQPNERFEDQIEQSKIDYQRGFKKAQELNDKRFSLEDMRRIYLQGHAEGYNHIGELTKEEFKKKLSQLKIFDIEVEMEPTEDSVRLRNSEIDYKGHSDIEVESVIKVTEGKIKITKKL